MGELNLDKFERAWNPLAELRSFRVTCSVDVERATFDSVPTLENGVTKLNCQPRRITQSSCKIEKLIGPFVLV